MMGYTPEQRAIIARMGEASRRIRAARARHRDSYITTSRSIVEAVIALATVIERSDELHVLLDEHSDAFHEFLDSL